MLKPSLWFIAVTSQNKKNLWKNGCFAYKEPLPIKVSVYNVNNYYKKIFPPNCGRIFLSLRPLGPGVHLNENFLLANAMERFRMIYTSEALGWRIFLAIAWYEKLWLWCTIFHLQTSLRHSESTVQSRFSLVRTKMLPSSALTSHESARVNPSGQLCCAPPATTRYRCACQSWNGQCAVYLQMTTNWFCSATSTMTAWERF